jgi:hypothetical protein
VRPFRINPTVVCAHSGEFYLSVINQCIGKSFRSYRQNLSWLAIKEALVLLRHLLTVIARLLRSGGAKAVLADSDHNGR